MLADRGDLESMLSDFSGADVANNDPAEISDANRFNGHVTRIVDGDTFWISGQDVRIRIWGSTLRRPPRPEALPPQPSLRG
jgi:hypothetical protein